MDELEKKLIKNVKKLVTGKGTRNEINHWPSQERAN
jgi:hypothetical protein